MKKLIWLLFCLLPCESAWTEDENVLPVRVVGLFTSGIGYFQHAGTVTGEGQVVLSFRDSQISDLLKSLVVEDLSGASPAPVVYPSHDPEGRLLEGFHVNLSGDPSLADILRQLRGTRVRLSIDGESVYGTLLGVEQRPIALGQKTRSDWVLNLATDKGLRVVPIKDMGLLELTDTALRADLQQALETLNQGRDHNRKSILLHFPGQGVRQVRVGYTVEAPVWKTSYRFLLPKEGETARVQGWAIVENQSNSDWKGVRLLLVSGQPLSFIQNLYQPYYATRPPLETKLPSRVMAFREQLTSDQLPSRLGVSAKTRAIKMTDATDKSEDVSENTGKTSKESWKTEALNASGSAVAAEKVGPLFQFVVDGVDLPQRRGAMIPIISETVTLEKVSIYNKKTMESRPLQSILLKNTTEKHFPAGPVALFNDGFYGGDARLEDLSTGQEQLLSYAVDQEIRVLGPTNQTNSLITSGKIVGGVLTTSRKQLLHQEYRFENHGKEIKTLLIEHPVRQGWTLSGSVTPMESTADWHRFRQIIPGGEKKILIVTEEQTNQQQLVILKNSSNQLFAQVQGNTFSPVLRQALEQVAVLQQSLETSKNNLDEKTQSLETLKKEQERIHANLSAVASGSTFHNKMIHKLDELETSIEQAQVEMENLRVKHRKHREQLETYLENLQVE